MILVTGVNGFLGSEVSNQLNSAGNSVRGSDIQDCPKNSKIDYIKADLLEPEQLKLITKNISSVIHVAGLAHVFSLNRVYHRRFKLINEIGTKNILSAAVANGVGHFILISTVSVYGPYTKGAYNEDTPCNPVGPYALSKYNAEQRAQEYAQKFGMPLTILRLATLYGEGDPGNVGRLIHSIDKRHFIWIGNGSNRKSLLYKGDAARACLEVIKKPRAGINIYNVSAAPCTMNRIVTYISKLLDKKLLPLRVSSTLALQIGKLLSQFPHKKISNLNMTIKKWIAEDVYNTSRIERDYDFHAQVDLFEGLKREVFWYRHHSNS